jgi:hypothetical protein
MGKRQPVDVRQREPNVLAGGRPLATRIAEAAVLEVSAGDARLA